MYVQGTVFVLFAICTDVSICTGGSCQDYHGLIPERVCLCKIPIRRFSLCSGVLLLGALKRPTEPAKNQSATI